MEALKNISKEMKKAIKQLEKTKNVISNKQYTSLKKSLSEINEQIKTLNKENKKAKKTAKPKENTVKDGVVYFSNGKVNKSATKKLEKEETTVYFKNGKLNKSATKKAKKEKKEAKKPKAPEPEKYYTEEEAKTKITPKGHKLNVIVFKMIKPLPITNSTYEVINDMIFENFEKHKPNVINVEIRQEKGGKNELEWDDDGDIIQKKQKNYIATSYKKEEGMKTDLLNKLKKICDLYGSSQIHSFQYIMFVDDNKGGLYEPFKTLKDIKISNDESPEEYTAIHYVNLETQTKRKINKNNCFIDCMNYFFETSGKYKEYNSYSVKKHFKIGVDDMITIEEAFEILKYYNKLQKTNKGMTIYGHSNKILKTTGNDIHITLINEHYIPMKIKTKINCKNCGHTHNKDKKCNHEQVEYYNAKICKRKILRKKKLHEKFENKLSDIVFYDFECYPDEKTGAFIPYAVGIKCAGQYVQYYGEKTMEKFIEYIGQCKDKIFVGYNSCRFDNYFLVNSLNKYGIKCADMIISSGRILRLNFGNNNSVWDINLFINGSLKKACESFNCVNRKGEVEHNDINSWEMVEKLRSEIEPYLEKDILCLEELYEKFSQQYYNDYQLNVINFYTICQSCFYWWSCVRPDELITIPDEKKYKFIREATYGARVQPFQEQYKSKLYDDIINGKITYEELLKSGEFNFNADVRSLYPSAMKGIKYDNIEVKTQYPMSGEVWIEKPENAKKAFEAGFQGFYEVSYKCPKNIITPILEKKENGALKWNLLDGCGVYAFPSLNLAVQEGYEVEFKRALIYRKSGNPFEDVVEKIFNKKATAKKEGNKVQELISKLMINSLYGKFNQKPSTDKTLVIDNLIDYANFVNEYELKTFEIIENENGFVSLIVGGEKRNIENEINKPSQIGAYILSWSKVIMYKYFKLLGLNMNHGCSYTDTDSLHIHGEIYKKALELKLIGSNLGQLANDCENDGLIIREINLGPKNYMYEYIDKNGKIYSNENAITKCKGIRGDSLDYKFYEEEISDNIIPRNMFENKNECEFMSFKKRHLKIENKNKNVFERFSVQKTTIKRQFNKNQWSGAVLKDNLYYPVGYEF